MHLCAALLKGVNVGGRGKIAMTDLKAWAEGLGFRSVRTLLQSGNMVFDPGDRAGAELEAFLETQATERLALSTAFLVRTQQQLNEAIAANPFEQAARRDPSHLLVVFLKAEPEPSALEALRSAASNGENLSAAGRHLYATFPQGIAGSRLASVIAGPKMRTPATARNWNTVQKLHSLLGG